MTQFPAANPGHPRDPGDPGNTGRPADLSAAGPEVAGGAAATSLPPPLPPHSPPQQFVMAAAPPKRRIWPWVMLFLVSLFFNLVLIFAVVAALGVGSMTAVTQKVHAPLQEVVVEDAATADRIAIIRVEGIITEEPMSGFSGPVGTDYSYLRKQVEQAMADDRVKAVILKVNSPGGGASASDMMLHELQKLHDEADKPIVVHMGSLAASGGYYVSMAGDKIFAQPTCLTGSIGVIGQFMSLQGLMQDTLKIKTYTIKSGPLKDVGSMFRDMKPEEMTYLQETLIQPMFQRFKDVVAKGRNMSEAQVDAVATGQIFTADQAMKNGLIDGIGFFDVAVKEALQMAGLSEAKLVRYERRRPGLLELLGSEAAARNVPLVNLSRDNLEALATPQVMMIWKIE